MRTPPLSELAGARYRTVTEADMIASLLIAAQPFELAAGRHEEAQSHTAEALEGWVKAGLGFESSPEGTRLFDPVEVFNHMKWAGVSGLDGFWSNHFVRTGRAFTRDLVGDDGTGAMPGKLEPARFCLTLRRRFDLSRLQSRTKARLRLPLPLESCAHNIKVTPIFLEPHAGRVSQSDGRLEFQIDTTADPFVEVAVETSFTTTGRSNDFSEDRLDPAALELYLRPSEGLIRVTSRIGALSHSFGGEDGSWDVVLKCWNYLIDELSCGMVRYDQVDNDAPGDWVLDTGWYDCQLGSSLFVSLCRARGIPARLMSGHMLYKLAPGIHYWAEVWKEGRGWLPFDFLSWDLSEAGRDEVWRDRFAGNIDYRMVTQCLPLAFTGPLSVRFPPAWQLVNAPAPGGMTIKFSDLAGALIYSDQVTVEQVAV